VTKGGDLRPGPDGAAPKIIVKALRDPDGSNLDRIQIAKGWLDAEGVTREKNRDIARAGRAIVNGSCESGVGSTVAIAAAS
jgi:hypothetical protein